jgi:hypothetical protein
MGFFGQLNCDGLGCGLSMTEPDSAKLFYLGAFLSHFLGKNRGISVDRNTICSWKTVAWLMGVTAVFFKKTRYLNFRENIPV